MENLLFHIDSRCIHGQIIAGWGMKEGIRRFLLADDAVSADEWERNQYLAAPGPDFDTLVMDIASAVQQLTTSGTTARTMLIVSSPRDARRILEAGIEHDVITIGNLDPGPEKHQLAANVYVTQHEEEDLAQIIARGVQVLIKALPDSRPILVADILARR